MKVEEAPNIRTLYDLWLVRWGEESVDIEHALNNDPYWYSVYCTLRANNLIGYDYGNHTYKLETFPWK